MVTHSSTLAWKIPWTEEPGRLQSMGLWRVWHNWVTSLSLFTFTHWRRKWQPTPVFLPGESQGRGSLVGCRLWGRTRLKWLSSMAESQEQLKSLLMKLREESEKVGLKHNTQKTKIMVSGPIISWQIDGKRVETVADFIFWGSNHCRWWLQPWN